MRTLRDILSYMKSVAKSTDFYYLLVIVSVGSFAILVYGFYWRKIVYILGLSALICFVLSLVLRVAKSYNKYLYRTALVSVACLLNVLMIIDLYGALLFHKPFDQDMVDVLAETNPRESLEFLNTYMPVGYVVVFALVMICVNVVLYKSLQMISAKARRIIGICLLMLCAVGVSSASVSVYSYIRYRNGVSVPQYTSLTRVCYAIINLNSKVKMIDAVAIECASLRGHVASDESDSTVYVVVIGESYSRAHSSLYGYELPTNPRLQARADSGELCVYSDVVTIDDHTHTVLKSLYSLAYLNKDFGHYPLFPAVFKEGGYNTALYDNQYLEGYGVSFLNNALLSDIMFDFRNIHTYRYDGEMLADVGYIPDRSLVILHLMGQHYTYADRYPDDFAPRFDASMYPHVKSDHKQVAANYDNSILYVDSIMDRLMDKLSSRDACVVYLSDHGEEVAEYDDFVGHGTAAYSRGLRNQICVPLMIWGSPSFRESAQWPRILAARDRRVSTDDLAHTMLDLAGLQTSSLDLSRSFINDGYVIRHRIVLNSIDFDSLSPDKP